MPEAIVAGIIFTTFFAAAIEAFITGFFELLNSI